MEFNLNKSIEILERTPQVLNQLLSGISLDWIINNEGGETWSPFDVLGHLIYGEQTDWMVRLEIIMNNNVNKTFTLFDRFAQFKESIGKTLPQLLKEFESLRLKNLQRLRDYHLTVSDYAQTAIHPDLGEITLSELLATWTIHDLTHIAQITRVMAKQYHDAIGPWSNYFKVMQ